MNFILSIENLRPMTPYRRWIVFIRNLDSGGKSAFRYQHVAATIS